MALEYLQKIGKAMEQLKDITSSPISDVLFTFAKSSVEQMKSLAPKSTGGLAASITWKPVKDGDKSGIEMIADDYWDYINSGVDGTAQGAGALPNRYGTTYSFASHAKTSSSGMSFKQSIQNWMIEKSIKPKEGNDYAGLAYVIMQAVKRKGIKPTPFVNKVLTEEAIAQLQSDVADAFAKMI